MKMKEANLDAPTRPRGEGPITLTISGALAEKIRDISMICRSASAHTWCLEALEFMLDEHRSGRYRVPADHYTERNGNDFTHVRDEDI